MPTYAIIRLHWKTYVGSVRRFEAGRDAHELESFYVAVQTQEDDVVAVDHP